MTSRSQVGVTARAAFGADFGLSFEANLNLRRNFSYLALGTSLVQPQPQQYAERNFSHFPCYLQNSLADLIHAQEARK